jgi:hypothetical protein
MPISGLVITLTDDVDTGQAALAAMERHSAICVGQLTGLRLPIVVETPDSDADREVWEWLHTLPGVALVNVAVVHFNPLEPLPATSSGAHFKPDA